MNVKNIIGLFCLLVLVVGCQSANTGKVVDTSSDKPAAEQPAIVEQPVEEQAAEQTEETAEETNNAEEDVEAAEGSSLEITLTAEGFEKEEISVAKGSELTIINNAPTMHKLNGGELFKGQFNTYLKSLYGGEDPLDRNKLVVKISDAGEYEVKDTTTNTILKIKAE